MKNLVLAFVAVSSAFLIQCSPDSDIKSSSFTFKGSNPSEQDATAFCAESSTCPDSGWVCSVEIDGDVFYSEPAMSENEGISGLNEQVELDADLYSEISCEYYGPSDSGSDDTDNDDGSNYGDDGSADGEDGSEDGDIGDDGSADGDDSDDGSADGDGGDDGSADGDGGDDGDDGSADGDGGDDGSADGDGGDDGSADGDGGDDGSADGDGGDDPDTVDVGELRKSTSRTWGSDYGDINLTVDDDNSVEGSYEYFDNKDKYTGSIRGTFNPGSDIVTINGTWTEVCVCARGLFGIKKNFFCKDGTFTGEFQFRFDIKPYGVEPDHANSYYFEGGNKKSWDL